MQSTRNRIIELIEESRTATAPQLANTLAMTEANIRHHLGVLVEMDELEVVGETEPDGRGRPQQLYMRTRRAQAHSLDALASALLNEIESTRSEKRRREQLAKLVENLNADSISNEAHISTRLNECAQRLNELNYQAHWEAHADGPRVILGHCPYTTIIDQHPILCEMDAALLEKMLDQPVVQLEKFSRRPRQPPACVFALQNIPRKR